MKSPALASCVLLLTLGTSLAGPAKADELVASWQMQRLFQPTRMNLASEARGRIMIYDGLTDQAVARALDEQFDRVDAMMFTRIVVTDEAGSPQRDSETGEIVTENDGCD